VAMGVHANIYSIIKLFQCSEDLMIKTIKNQTALLMMMIFANGFLICPSVTPVHAQESNCSKAIEKTRNTIKIASIRYNDPNIDSIHMKGNPFSVSDTISIALPDNRKGNEWMVAKYILPWADYLIRSCRNVVLVQIGISQTDNVGFVIWDGKKSKFKECIFSDQGIKAQYRKFNSNPWVYVMCPG